MSAAGLFYSARNLVEETFRTAPTLGNSAVSVEAAVPATFAECSHRARRDLFDNEGPYFFSKWQSDTTSCHTSCAISGTRSAISGLKSRLISWKEAIETANRTMSTG